jgi:UDP-N-acetyl-D-glucosamine dehydrogenase
VRYHDPLVHAFEDASGAVRESEGLDQLLDWAQVIVVVTAHRAIDWARIYDTADLVIDTVNSSEGQRTKPGQVLRLGAGWGTASGPLETVPVSPAGGQAAPRRS